MTGQTQSKDAEKARIILGLLESVSRDGTRSQRHLANDLDIALGLVNAYLRRCVTKGLVKVSQVPARRYAYYLTPKGFAEKSRLTVEFLTSSLGFFRRAKADCAKALETARARQFKRVVLAGRSDIAEITAICALDAGVVIVAVVDEKSAAQQYLGLPAVASFGDVAGEFDAIVVTDLLSPQAAMDAAVDWIGADRVLVPDLLRSQIGSVKRKTRA